MDDAKPGPTPAERAGTEEERRQAAWLEWVNANLGHDPVRAEAAATAAREAMGAGRGIDVAYEAARSKWHAVPPSVADPAIARSLPPPMNLKTSVAAWQAAGIIDTATAARIEAYESSRPPSHRGSTGISVSEVVAYVGSIVLLVGVGFLYATQYESLGTAGRLMEIGLVVAAGLAAGELVRLMGGSTAALRARSAGWAVAALALAAWFAQLFLDSHVLTGTGGFDTRGPVMLGAALGFVFGLSLLWRAGAGLVALATSILAYIAAGAFDAYSVASATPWQNESAWLVAAVALWIASEVLTVGHERRWAREVIRFMIALMPALAALVFSGSTDGEILEYFAGLLAVGAFALALWRGSAGYAIAGGIALFVVVNEVGFRLRRVGRLPHRADRVRDHAFSGRGRPIHAAAEIPPNRTSAVADRASAAA